MTPRFLKTAVVIIVSVFLSMGAGCNKSRQKLEMPDIKMITPESVHGVIAVDDDHIWLTGKFGIIFYSEDGGRSWTRQESGIKSSTLVDGSFIDCKTGWVVGISGIILHTSDGGKTWVKQDSGTDRHLFGICFVDKNNGWAVGEWSTILSTSDGGRTWIRLAPEADKIYNNVVFVDKDTGWIAGERGTILHTTDGGRNWQEQMPKAFERNGLEDELLNPRPTLFSVFFTDKNNGWLCGIDGMILKTVNGGELWEIISAVTDLALYTVFIKDGKGWAVGDKGAYLVSDDGGTTWQRKEDMIKTKQGLRDVFFSSVQKGWVVGAAGTVVHTDDGGESWEFRSGLSYAMEFFKMPKALEFGGGVE